MTTTTPQTQAGRALLNRLAVWPDAVPDASAILAIEREAAAAALERVRAALHASASRVIAEGDETRAQAWVGIRKWADGIILAFDLDAEAAK